jgi:hypothetical protein
MKTFIDAEKLKAFINGEFRNDSILLDTDIVVNRLIDYIDMEINAKDAIKMPFTKQESDNLEHDELLRATDEELSDSVEMLESRVKDILAELKMRTERGIEVRRL